MTSEEGEREAESEERLWRGVFELGYERAVLFTQQVEVKTADLPGWEPHITLDTNRGVGSEACRPKGSRFGGQFMLTEQAEKSLRFLADPAACPEGYRIRKGDQNAVREVLAEFGRLESEFARMMTAYAKNDYEIEQILGRALGYPRFADDQKNFPGATDADGVCVGEHVIVTLAEEAAERIGKLRDEVGRLVRFAEDAD